MISTIQIKSETKKKLELLKKKKAESYEQVIDRLLEKEFVLREQLKEGYLAQYDELKKLNKEWENADSTWE